MNTIGNNDEANAQLNQDLETLNKWASKWIVLFNPSKSKSLAVSLKKNCENIKQPLIFNGEMLENVNSHKYLGIELSTTLTWKEHITRKVEVLVCLKHLLNRKKLTIMYTSFLRPSHECGNVIFV